MVRESKTLLKATGIWKEFPTPVGTIRALAPTDLTVNAGSIAVVKGKSGSGKSTLLRILSLNLAPSGGELLIRGESAPVVPSRAASAMRAGTFGVVFQDLLLDERLSLVDNMTLPLAMAKGKKSVVDALPWARQLAQILGLSHRWETPVALLSGGERQRTAIARAFILRPPLLVLDEPTAHLDEDNAHVVGGALAELATLGHAIIVATHTAHFDRWAETCVELGAGEPSLKKN